MPKYTLTLSPFCSIMCSYSKLTTHDGKEVSFFVARLANRSLQLCALVEGCYVSGSRPGWVARTRVLD
jgi:hypothetical protein